MYGEYIEFDLTSSPDNAERIARTLAEAGRFPSRQSGENPVGVRGLGQCSLPDK